MASLFVRSFFRPQTTTLGLGLGLSLACYRTISHRRPILLDGSSLSKESYRQNAQTPILRQGRLNSAAVRQMSSGSIIGRVTLHPLTTNIVELMLTEGLCTGLLVSTFSRSLALLIGLLVVGVQVSNLF